MTERWPSWTRKPRAASACDEPSNFMCEFLGGREERSVAGRGCLAGNADHTSTSGSRRRAGDEAHQLEEAGRPGVKTRRRGQRRTSGVERITPASLAACNSVAYDRLFQSTKRSGSSVSTTRITDSGRTRSGKMMRFPPRNFVHDGMSNPSAPRRRTVSAIAWVSA